MHSGKALGAGPRAGARRQQRRQRNDAAFTADPRGSLSASLSNDELLREANYPQQLQLLTQLPLLDAGAVAGTGIGRFGGVGVLSALFSGNGHPR